MAELSTEQAQNLCGGIEDSLGKLFSSIDLGFETAAQAHAENLVSLSPVLTSLKTHNTCLFCLRRKPEHVLTCGHAICDVCVRIYGSMIPGNESKYVISKCILCAKKGSLTTRLKPVTAGVRILSIDGGGVRGVVPLEFLRLLQGILGAELLIQDLFDQAFGTSSGTMT